MTLPLRQLLLSLLPAVLMGVSLLAPADAAAPERLPLRDLDRGPAPAVPYIADRVLVDGSVRIDLPRSLGRMVGRVGQDYLVQGFSVRNGEEVIERISLDGTRTRLFEAISLSDATLADDAASFVVSELEAAERTTLRRFDVGTGAITLKRVIRGYANLLDYDGTVVVLGGFGRVGTVLWDVATDTLTRVTRQPGYEADLDTDRLARVTKDAYAGGCTVVTALSRPGRALWRSCDERVDAFSTDGSRMATIHILSDRATAEWFKLRSTTGRLLAAYEAPYFFGRLWFENGTDVLAGTYGENAGALVRCDAAGCERATRIFDDRPPPLWSTATGTGPGPLDSVGSASVRIVLGDLDRGPDLATPVLIDQTLVGGSLHVELPRWIQARSYLGRSGDNHLVEGYDEKRNRDVVFRITPDGRRTRVAQGAHLSNAVLSDDGASFVTSRTFGTERTVLRRHDAVTGEVTLRRDVPDSAHVLDFDGSVAVLSGSGSIGTSTWDLAANEVDRLLGQEAYAVDLAADRMARTTNGEITPRTATGNDKPACSVVTSISRPRQVLWKSCEEAVLAFSTDGSHAASTSIYFDGPGPGRVWLRTIAGTLLAEYDSAHAFGYVGFEGPRSLLLETFSRRSVAAVRCDVRACERASPLQRHEIQFRPGTGNGAGG